MSSTKCHLEIVIIVIWRKYWGWAPPDVSCQSSLYCVWLHCCTCLFCVAANSLNTQQEGLGWMPSPCCDCSLSIARADCQCITLWPTFHISYFVGEIHWQMCCVINNIWTAIADKMREQSSAKVIDKTCFVLRYISIKCFPGTPPPSICVDACWTWQRVSNDLQWWPAAAATEYSHATDPLYGGW